MTLHVGPSDCAIARGYETDSKVSAMPPIHNNVFTLADGMRGFVGSNAQRFGGMKWRVPGWEDAGGDWWAAIVG